MIVLFDAEIHVHYGFLWLLADGEQQPADLLATRAGQRNGLCGAAVPGVLSMMTGLHTGNVPVTVRWHDEEPPLDDEWADVVEAPFAPAEPGMTLSAFDQSVAFRLPAAGSLRVRYSGAGLDAARDQDTRISGLPLDRYRLDLWPAPPAPDEVIRETAKIAAYWHKYARTAPAVTAEERAAKAGAALGRRKTMATRVTAKPAQRATTTRPTALSRAVPARAGVPAIVSAADQAVLDALARLDPPTQRAAARWLARRAFEIAELAELDWVRPALAAMDRGDPLPEPFTSLSAVYPRVLPDGQQSPRGAKPGEPRHRPSFALPTIFRAVNEDPAEAVARTYRGALSTFHDRREELVTELRERYLPDPEAG
jgi:hypothetical protein